MSSHVESGQQPTRSAPRRAVAFGGTSKLVAHFKDGHVTKGFSRDFDPSRDSFHLIRREGEVAASQEIHLEDLKALFHVKTWGRKDKHAGLVAGFPSQKRSSKGTKATLVKTVLEFYDGEKIYGYSFDYDPNHQGFYVVPADPSDNNRTIYVVHSALVNIQFVRE
jgi:hypothetical protein